MTEEQKRMAVALGRCSFYPGTAVKRFARNMAFAAEQPDPKPLTEKQRKYLADMVVMYRRQIADSVVELARQETAALESGKGQ